MMEEPEDKFNKVALKIRNAIDDENLSFSDSFSVCIGMALAISKRAGLSDRALMMHLDPFLQAYKEHRGYDEKI